MKIRFLAASALFALAACGGADDNDGTVDSNVAAAGNEMENGALPGNEAAVAGETAANGQQYAEMAGAGDLYEIESSRLALEKAQRPEVRELAQMIITDHERSTRELTSAAQQAQPPITLAPKLNAEQQANMDALRGASGEAFDGVYLTQQLQAHEKALNLVTAYAQNGDVEALRGHASAVSGPIRQHLTRVRELQTSSQ